MPTEIRPAALVHIPERSFVALVFSKPPGGQLRFLFAYHGELRAISWLNIGRDGSLYLNARTTRGKPIIHGTGTANGFGGFWRHEWDPARPTPEDHQNRKVSYHSSGRTKGGGRMSTSISLRTLGASTLIRQDDYAHPSKFAVVAADALRKRDIVVPAANGQPFELKDDARLTSHVFAAPLQHGDAQVRIVDDDPGASRGQTAIVTPAINLEGCQDLTFQIHFFVRHNEPWPEMTTIAVPDVDESGSVVVEPVGDTPND